MTPPSGSLSASDRERARLVPPPIFVAAEKHSESLEAMAAHTITARWIERAMRGLGPGADLPYDHVRAALSAELTGMMMRSLVLELALANRVGVLPGTLHEQYRSFFGDRSLDALIDYLSRKYPALAALVDHRVASAVRYCDVVEGLWRDDRAALSPGLVEDGAEIIDLEPLGDTHEHGIRSGKVHLSSGEAVAFKPSSARPQGFLTRFGAIALSGRNILQVPKTVARGSHHWQRWESGDDLVDEDSAVAAQTFGRWLAIAHLTGTTDLHYENFIVGRAGILAVDLETVASAQLRIDDAPVDSRDDLARTLILPFRMGGVDNVPGPNWGAWGGDHRSAAGFPRFMLDNDETPHIRLRQVLVDAEERSQVDLAEVRRSIAAYPLFREGFIEAMRSARANATALSALIGSQGGMRSRVVLRATQTYYESIAKATHPVELLSRRRFRAALEGNLPVAHLEGLIPAELALLSRGEIPRFHAKFDQSSVRGVALDSPATVIRRRMDALVNGGDHMLTLFEQDIEAHVVAFSFLGELPAAAETREAEESLPPASAAIAASVAAMRVVGSSWPTNPRTWSNVNPTMSGLWARERSMPNFYSGMPGVYVSLSMANQAEAGRVPPEFVTGLAHEILNLSVEPPKDLANPGAFAGYGGVAYALGRAVLAEDVTLEDGVAGLASLSRTIEESVREDACFDLIAGAAGAVAVFAELVRCGVLSVENGAEVVEPAINHLKLNAMEHPDGLVWPNVLWDGDWVSGLSHGGVGIGWALRRWARVSGDSEAERIASAAIGVQDGLRDGQFHWREKKPTARVPDENQTSWCHGSQGVLLSVLDDEPLDAQGLAQFATDSHAVPLPKLSGLCHGAAGQLVLLQRMHDRARALGLTIPEPLSASIQEITESLTATVSRRRVVGVDAPDLWSASLMTGQAGIVHALSVVGSLDSSREPTVLLLELAR